MGTPPHPAAAENAETPCGPLRKKDKKSQTLGLATKGLTALVPGRLLT